MTQHNEVNKQPLQQLEFNFIEQPFQKIGKKIIIKLEQKNITTYNNV